MTDPAPDAERRARLSELCLAWPDAECSGDQHLAFRVRGRTFAYYLDDHHGDARIALCCKAAPGESERRIATHPERYFRPAYLGARGWLGGRLDLNAVDWEEVADLVAESYTLVAPKRLARQQRAV